MPSVDDQIDKAKAAAARDRDAAAALSALKLMEVKRKPPRAAAAHLQDPELTSEDQRDLFSWLSRLLPRQVKKPKARRSTHKWPLAKLLRPHPGIAFALVASAAVLGSAARNTPRVYLGTVTSDMAVNWQIGGATVATQTLLQSTQVPVMGRTGDGYLLIRGWLARTGHITAFVPETAIQPQP